MAPRVEPGQGPQGERSRDPQDGTDGGPVPGAPGATALPHAVGQQDQRDHQGLLEERRDDVGPPGTLGDAGEGAEGETRGPGDDPDGDGAQGGGGPRRGEEAAGPPEDKGSPGQLEDPEADEEQGGDP